VPGVDFRVVGKRRQDFVEGVVHFRGGALEELAAATDEERVACEHRAMGRGGGGVFEIVADAVLGVAGGVEGGDGDVFADGECGVVGWRSGDGVAVFAADDGSGGELVEDLGVAAGVVPVVVGVDDGG
jgi:hypothetical protein